MTRQIRILMVKQGNVKEAELARRLGQSRSNFNSKMKRDNFSVGELREIAAALGCELEIHFIDKASGEKTWYRWNRCFFHKRGGKGMIIHPRTPLVVKTKSGLLWPPDYAKQYLTADDRIWDRALTGQKGAAITKRDRSRRGKAEAGRHCEVNRRCFAPYPTTGQNVEAGVYNTAERTVLIARFYGRR